MGYRKLVIYTDGGARGNPGPGGIGAVIINPSATLTGSGQAGSPQEAGQAGQVKVIAEISEYIGESTNNQAEYKAVIAALERAKAIGAEELEFFLDSELVVKQLNREYKVKDKDLASLFVKIHNLSFGFKKITFKHIPREMNKEADRLANEAMDKGA